MKTTKNYIFDIDGTLTRDYSSVELLPNVGQFFARGEYDHVGFASNQGGVGLRLWMETWDPIPDNITNYPTEDTALLRISQILTNIVQTGGNSLAGLEENLCLCYAYRNKKGKWGPQPKSLPSYEIDFWRRDWRKPAPGMLLDLIEFWSVRAQDVIMVGDRPEDLAAALNAGARFQWAHDFFDFTPELIWLEPTLPGYNPENIFKITGRNKEEGSVEFERLPIKYYRLANLPPNLEVIELDDSQFSPPDDKFKQAMDDISGKS